MNGKENKEIQTTQQENGAAQKPEQESGVSVITEPPEIKWEQEPSPETIAAKCLRIGKQLLRNFSFWFLIGSTLLIVLVMHFSRISQPAPLDIQFSAAKDFPATGIVSVTGFSKLSIEELADCITVKPATAFTVVRNPADSASALIELRGARNIAYAFTFERGQADSEDYHKKEFTANGPALSVRIAGTSVLSPHSSLTLEFNEQVDIFSLEQNLTIEPKTSYSLEYDRTRVTIVPNTQWNLSNNYTAKILAGYESANGKQFAEHQVVGFKVSDPYAAPVYQYVEFISSRNYILNDSRDMNLIFSAERLREDIPVIVETYRMPSVEKYREQGHIYLDYNISLDYLEKVDTNAYLLSNGHNSLTVPHFGQGGYIISATFTDPNTGKERKERTSYLITDLSVYMQSSNRETVIWLNSSKTGNVLSGYQVAFEGGEPLGVTDADGVLVVPHGEDALQNSYLNIYDADGALVYYDNTGLNADTYHRERFYSYFFLDRSIYKPEDTVCFWGFVQPFRYNQQQMPGNVVVRFDSGGLDIEVEAAIDADGVFTGEIPLEKIRSSQYSVSAELTFPAETEGGIPVRHVFESEYISVQEYVKPSYTLSSSVDEDYYGPKDEVTATVSAAFFDGTPLPFFPVEVSYYDPGNYRWMNLPDVTTDELGNATFTFPAYKGGGNPGSGKGPTSGRFMAKIASDGESVNHVGRYTVFPSDVLVETEFARQPDGKNLALTVRTYQLNMNSSALRAAMAERKNSYYYLDNARLLEIARGAPVDVDLEISLRWDYYDNHNIRHRYLYDYSLWGQSSVRFEDSYSLNYIVESNPRVKIINDPNTQEKKVSLRTENGAATVTDLIYLNEGSAINFERNAYSRVWIRYKDGLDNRCDAYDYYPGFSSYREDWEEEDKPPVPGYSFQVTDLATGEDRTPTTSWYRTVTMGVGSTARFSLLLDGAPVDAQGSILYSIIQDGLYEYHVTDGNYIDVEFKPDYANNVKLVAVYFDGQGTAKIKHIDLNADMTSMALNIAVTPNKESYRPGDQVRLTVKTTDSNGRGVAGNLCVAVVDEAIFALSEQYVSVLSDLYGDMWGVNNYVSQYFTTYRDEPEEYPGDGGKGDGEGAEFYDSYRSNFKDTAIFFPTKTDAGGNATVVFDLPDNTTSWRITAVEVGHNLMAGQSKSNIISTLPFFVKPVLTSKYIEGDDFSMLVQGHGTLLSADDEINYTVTVTGDGVNETKTVAGKAYQPVEMNFGKLPTGSYKVVSKAQYSGYSDTVELPVSVIKSNLELIINKSIDIKETLDISAVRYPVTLTFYDKENEPFMSSLSSMFGHYCMQTSQRMPRFVAKRALRQSLPGEDVPSYIQDTRENLADMQNPDGGIGSAVDAESDPLLTTYVLLVAKDQFNLKSMTRYFHNQLKVLTNPKERAACYLGLAAIGETDAETLLTLLDDAVLIDEKAYYIAGLAYLNETETAQRLYDEHLAPHLKDMNARSHPYVYRDYSAQELAWERDTAAIWIAATRLQHPDADAIALHFAKNQWRIRTLYECMIYVSNHSKEVRPISFTYSTKGQQHQVNLGYSGMQTVVLSKSEMESLRFISYPENLKAVAYYVGEPTEIGLEQSENMRIQKSMRSLGQNTYEVSLKLTLTDDAPAGQYDISDWVPSNSRLYKIDGALQANVYLNSRSEGQNLYFSAHLNPAQNKELTIKYQIRVTFTGEAVLDTAYVIHGDTGENCNTEKSVFQPEQING